jgi:transporter family-2 protein
MDRTTAVLLTALMGGAVALQAPINSGLGKRVGTFQGAFLSFIIGACLLCVIAAFSRGGLGNLAAARHVRWYYLVGGLLGAGYVTTVLVTVRTLGAGGVTAATISGQLIMAVVIDQLGLLGVARHPVSTLRLVGVVLLACGTYLVVRE